MTNNPEIHLEAGVYNHSAHHSHGRWAMGSPGSFHHSHWNHFPKYFPLSVIFLPYFPLVHLIPDCLSLIEHRGPLTAVIPPFPPSHPDTLPLLPFSSSILSDVIIWLYPTLSLTGPVSPSPPTPLVHLLHSPIIFLLTYISVSHLWRSQFNSR